MPRTSTFMYGIFYNHLSCCTLQRCFITYFRAFPKTHVKEIQEFTFRLRKYEEF